VLFPNPAGVVEWQKTPAAEERIRDRPGKCPACVLHAGRRSIHYGDCPGSRSRLHSGIDRRQD